MGDRRAVPAPRLAAALGFVLVSFSLNSVMTRYVVAHGLLDPGLTTAVRFLAGAVSLAVIAAGSGDRKRVRPGRSSLLPAFWLGAYAILISYGYEHIGAAAGTFVFYACVLGTMAVGGTILDGIRPTPRAFAGGVLALAGLALLTVGRVEGTTSRGVMMLAGTGLSWGAYSLLGRRAVDPRHFTTRNFFALAIALIPLAALRAWDRFPSPVVTTPGIAIAAFMGGVTTALSYIVWYWCMPRITPTQAGTYQLAIPVFTAILGGVLLQEAITARLGIAGGLVVIGMALVSAPGGTWRRDPTTAAQRASEPQGRSAAPGKRSFGFSRRRPPR